MAKRRTTDAEHWDEYRARRRRIEQIWQQRVDRLAAVDAREAKRRARLRRLSFGLFGREPTRC